MKIWAKTEEFSEGKYLVVRRDGTTPDWPHFVIGGDDPCAAAALRAYANEAHKRGLEADYVHSIDDLASDFELRTGGKADPDKGPHRTDLPLAIAMMRRQTNVASISAELDNLRHQLAQSQAEAKDAWRKGMLHAMEIILSHADGTPPVMIFRSVQSAAAALAPHDARTTAGDGFLPGGRTAACADLEADLPTLAHTLAEQARADEAPTPPTPEQDGRR